MGTYIRLVDINDAKGKESAFLSAVQDKNSSIRFETSAENFSKIPGSPVAYWVRGNMLKAFSSALPSLWRKQQKPHCRVQMDQTPHQARHSWAPRPVAHCAV